MILRSATIASTLFFIGWSSALGQTPSVPIKKSQERCTQPIGRVISDGDSRLNAGSFLCQGDTLHLVRAAKVEVLCYLNRQVLLLGKGSISDRCFPLADRQQLVQCTRYSRSKCPVRKGPTEDDNTPVLIAPYNSIGLNARPDLTWTKVAGITSYQVKVEGLDVNWSQTVIGNSYLAYPQKQPSLKFGNAYKITIIANKGDSPVAASITTLNLIDKNQAQQVEQIIGKLDKLNLFKDEESYLDLDTVYMSYGLLTQSIEVLTAQVEAGSVTPAIYLTLGDRYLEAGLPNLAQPLYRTAIKLAQKIGDANQIEKAKAGLKNIARYSQLPTKIKLDQ